MKTQIRKFLQISIVVAVFCIVGIAGSVDRDVFTIKEGIIRIILTAIYIALACMGCIFTSALEDKV